MKIAISFSFVLFGILSSLCFAAPKPFTDSEIGSIPFSDGFDANGNPNKDAKDFEKKWKGKSITMKAGGIKISENYAVCSPKVNGLTPANIVTGTLDDKPRGGSGGNGVYLKNCKIEK
jgi:hypothetical protein